ncbi:MAG: HDIG domain-containing metalloprotein [Bacillota bacterium]|jgi:putative nucleotidyltransferase with HDIG domain
MNREQALGELKKRVKNRNLLKHMYAVEAVLRQLAKRLGGQEEQWALAGLLHDIDYEETAQNPEQHSLVGAEILADLGVAPEIVQAVKVHNSAHGLERRSLLDSALHIADPLTGLIVAAALIHPEKKLAAIDTQFVLNRFGDKQFARGANREQIALCREELGLDLEEFVGLGLEAMQAIAGDLEL